MSARVITQYASGAADPHNISLSGKVDGRDLFVFFSVAATPTLPAPWVEEKSVLAGSGGWFAKIWRLAAADNTSSVTQLTIDLNAGRPLAAVVWEDTMVGGTLYVQLQEQGPVTQNPMLHGSGLHTFPQRDETFALYQIMLAGSNPGFSTLTYTSYDQSYTGWADSGLAGPETATESQRIWMARKPDASMSNGGVVATANQTGVGFNGNGVTGMIAYDATPVGNPPVNTVAPAASQSGSGIGSTVSTTTGTWTGDPTITYTYQWRRNGAAISGATSSSYTVTLLDLGKTLTCAVTAANLSDSVMALSNGVAIPGEKLSIAQENSLPANITIPQLSFSGAGDLTNLGFCREFSLNVGETAHFACHGSGTVIDICRIGWYGGVGFRLVDTVTNTANTSQPAPATIANSNGATTCTGWTDTASWAIPATATPGMYVGVYRNAALNNASFIYFVVRDDSRPADVMIKTSDSTWALAYNYFDTMASPTTGKSYYGSGGPLGDSTTRSHAATYHKPIITRQGVPQTSPHQDEWPLIRFLERNGVDVTYSACKDYGPGGPTLANCKVYISNGHDEYWSQSMRDKWYALRSAGKKLIFFGGNSVFWRTRETDSNNVHWCYKDSIAGPGAHVAGVALDPVSWTGTWKDTRTANNATRDPEWNLMGTDFRMNGVIYKTLTIPAGSAYAQTPIWRNTDVNAAGLTVGELIGMEADEIHTTRSAEFVCILAQSTVNIDGSRADDNGAVYNLTGNLNWGVILQRWPNGGVTVGFGTCNWSWGLDNTHDVAQTTSTSRANAQMQQATLNLLSDLGAQPATLMSGLTQPTPVSLDAYATNPDPNVEDYYQGSSDIYSGQGDTFAGNRDIYEGGADSF